MSRSTAWLDEVVVTLSSCTAICLRLDSAHASAKLPAMPTPMLAKPCLPNIPPACIISLLTPPLSQLLHVLPPLSPVHTHTILLHAATSTSRPSHQYIIDGNMYYTISSVQLLHRHIIVRNLLNLTIYPITPMIRKPRPTAWLMRRNSRWSAGTRISERARRAERMKELRRATGRRKAGRGGTYVCYTASRTGGRL